AGLGYFGRNTDLAGLGLNWAEARGIDGNQFTLEAFYRFSISPGLQITPSVQFISDPLLNPNQDSITLFGLRTRIVF
ncbi:MAG: carbohydrate porin, partial [Pseudomonadota bacterium]